VLTGAKNDGHLVKRGLNTAPVHHWLVAAVDVEGKLFVVKSLEGGEVVDCGKFQLRIVATGTRLKQGSA